MESSNRPREVSRPSAAVTRSSVARCLRIVAVVAASISVGVGLAAAVLSDHSFLSKEDGLLEDASVVVWILSLVYGLLVAFARVPVPDRLLGMWLSVLSLLAGLRELDAQILLNPKTLGAYGVRYKLSWWLDGSVPFLLKLGWALLFLGVASLVLWPVFKVRRQLWGMVMGLDIRALLFGAAIIFLALGFVVDDLMRGSRLVSLEDRQLVEETAELIGSVLFLVMSALHWRTARRHPTQPAAD